MNKLDVSEKAIKMMFMIYFDGVYDIEPNPNVCSTYEMGVCKLDYNEPDNTLTVHLRRPGLLIGKAGETIDALTKYLRCKIKIIKVNLYK